MASKDEMIGFHKGSLAVLAKEQESFIQMLSIIQQLMQAHVKALKDLGVDIEAEIKKAQEAQKKKSGIDSRLK